MRVININGTSQNICKCGCWLNHWKRYSGQDLPRWCAEKSCIRAPAVGAHVQKDGYVDQGWYIVPLCNEHNRQINFMNLVEGVALVPANVSQTCGE